MYSGSLPVPPKAFLLLAHDIIGLISRLSLLVPDLQLSPPLQDSAASKHPRGMTLCTKVPKALTTERMMFKRVE